MQWTRRQIRNSKEDPSHDRIQSQSLGPSTETIRRDAVIVVPSTSLNVALHLAKNVTIVKRKITFLICAEVGIVAKAMAMVRDLSLKIPDSVIKTIMSYSHPKLMMTVNGIATNKSMSEYNSLANTCTILS